MLPHSRARLHQGGRAAASARRAWRRPCLRARCRRAAGEGAGQGHGNSVSRQSPGSSLPSVPAQALGQLARQRLPGTPPAPTLGRFPLLGRGPLKDIPHARCLLLEELGVLRALLAPGRVERGGVLVYQVRVLRPSRAPEVLDLGAGGRAAEQPLGGPRGPCPGTRHLLPCRPPRAPTCMTLGRMVLLK